MGQRMTLPVHRATLHQVCAALVRQDLTLQTRDLRHPGTHLERKDNHSSHWLATDNKTNLGATRLVECSRHRCIHGLTVVGITLSVNEKIK